MRRRRGRCDRSRKKRGLSHRLASLEQAASSLPRRRLPTHGVGHCGAQLCHGPQECCPLVLDLQRTAFAEKFIPSLPRRRLPVHGVGLSGAQLFCRSGVGYLVFGLEQGLCELRRVHNCFWSSRVYSPRFGSSACSFLMSRCLGHFVDDIVQGLLRLVSGRFNQK